ncbi:MAG TPA: SOS response-associated peptidase [Fulvivirga sp.]|nr:SOS response-associated peptidase [Fulvivirga sp.]
MCYDVAYLTKKVDKYAKHYGKPSDWNDLMKRLPPTFHTSGFNHADLPVITSKKPFEIQTYEWGLIPAWVKDPASATKLSNQTINARSEEMFSKPSFRDVAKTNHCLIIVDGFYEHHWHDGKSYPHYIKMKNDEPFAMAGIWAEWNGKRTVSLLTTSANSLMASIHNNPKVSESRMPVILSKENEEAWLKPILNDEDKEKSKQLLIPYEAGEMEAYTVPKLRGKMYLGNVAETQKRHFYPELENKQGTLF